MKRTSLISTSAVALALTFMVAEDARAQADEILVTAERRTKRLQETEISMTVMDDKMVEELGITDFVAIADYTPNVTMHDIPTSFGGAIGIRGFRNGETISTFEPKVALYLDGVLIAKNAGSAFSVLDLERIEVLRGPQGTLYGRNTVGGAVNLITKKPSSNFEGSVNLTVAEYDQRDLKATINVPLLGSSGDSRLNFRATLGTLNRDGYYRNTFITPNRRTNRRIAGIGRAVAHLQLQWEPTADFSALYAFDKTWIDETSPAPVLTRFNPVTRPTLAPFVFSKKDQLRIRAIEGPQFVKGEVEGHSLTLEWNPSEQFSLVSISALRKLTYDSGQDADGTSIWVINTLAGDTTETLTQELRAVGSLFDSKFEYVAGAYYMDEKIKEAYSYNQLPNAGGLSSNLDGTARNKIWAIFGQGTVHLTDRLDFTGGIRYTGEKRSMTRRDSTLFFVLPALNTVTVLPNAGPKSFDDISGTVSLSYQWSDDVMTYAKASKGYSSGGFNLRSPSPATFTTGYNEEVVYTYEFGWKSTWLDDRLLINGAVFYNDYKDLQVTVLDPATLRNNLVNAAQATISGAELEVQVWPMEHLQLGGGYGYLHTEYSSYIDPVTKQDLSKVNTFARAPKHQVNIFGRYEVPNFASIGNLVLRTDYSWQSKQALLAAPNNLIDSYGVWNARIALEDIRGPGDSTITIALWGKNLSNTLYYTSGFNLVSSLGFEGRFTGAPQSFGGDVIFRF